MSVCLLTHRLCHVPELTGEVQQGPSGSEMEWIATGWGWILPLPSNPSQKKKKKINELSWQPDLEESEVEARGLKHAKTKK